MAALLSWTRNFLDNSHSNISSRNKNA